MQTVHTMWFDALWFLRGKSAARKDRRRRSTRS